MTINIEITQNPINSDLAALHAESFSHSWSEEEFADMLRTAGTKAFVHECGFGLIRLVADEAELLTIAVRPEARGQGVGKALLEAMLNYLAEQKAELFFLEVRESNQAAIRLYEKAGFSQVAQRKNYYTHEDGTQETAFVMRCSIK